MKRLIALLIFAVSPAVSDWKLVWNDEFDKPGPPDPAKWTYEEGFVRNREDQYYTGGRLENARVENGCLVIEARREDYPNPAFVSKDHPDWRKNRENALYTSACLVTDGLASWTYGKVEIKARLPLGKGAWPAFWMLGTNCSNVGWPRCGEIDIMEHVTSDPGRVHGTVHWYGPANGRDNASRSSNIRQGSLDKWHIYGLEWDGEQIIFSVDGKEYGRFPVSEADGAIGGDNPFKQPFYLLVNLAVGGAWGGPPDPADYPQKLIVDYVRIYEKK